MDHSFVGKKVKNLLIEEKASILACKRDFFADIVFYFIHFSTVNFVIFYFIYLSTVQYYTLYQHLCKRSKTIP